MSYDTPKQSGVNQVALAGLLKDAPRKLEQDGQTLGVAFLLVTKDRIPDEKEPGGFRLADEITHVRVLDPDAVPDLLGRKAGDLLCVRGIIYTKSYEKDGERRWVTYVHAEEWGDSLNVAFVKGRCADKPGLIQMGESGRHKAQLRIGTNPYVRNLASGSSQPEAHFVSASCFYQAKAEAIASKHEKGDEIVVIGRLVTETYEHRETGKPVTNTFVRIRDFDWGRRKGAGGASAPDGYQPGAGSSSGSGWDTPPDFDDDIPF